MYLSTPSCHSVGSRACFRGHSHRRTRTLSHASSKDSPWRPSSAHDNRAKARYVLGSGKRRQLRPTLRSASFFGVRRYSGSVAVVALVNILADTGQARLLTNRGEQVATPFTTSLRNRVSGGQIPPDAPFVFGFNKPRMESDGTDTLVRMERNFCLPHPFCILFPHFRPGAIRACLLISPVPNLKSGALVAGLFRWHCHPCIVQWRVSDCGSGGTSGELPHHLMRRRLPRVLAASPPLLLSVVVPKLYLSRTLGYYVNRWTVWIVLADSILFLVVGDISLKRAWLSACEPKLFWQTLVFSRACHARSLRAGAPLVGDVWAARLPRLTPADLSWQQGDAMRRLRRLAHHTRSLSRSPMVAGRGLPHFTYGDIVT